MSNYFSKSNKFKILPFFFSVFSVVIIICLFIQIINKYNDNKLDKILNNPAYLKGKITDKHTYKRSSFDVLYADEKVIYDESLIVSNKTLKFYDI